MTASCKRTFLQLIIFPLITIFTWSAQGKLWLDEDTLSEWLQEEKYAEELIDLDEQNSRTIRCAPDGVYPKDWKDIYYFPIPLHYLRKCGHRRYIEDRLLVLLNNGLWLQFPRLRWTYWAGSRRLNMQDVIFYDAISITEVAMEGETVYVNDIEYKYDFRTNILRVTLKNNSERDIILLHSDCIHYGAPEGETDTDTIWSLKIDDKQHMLRGTSEDQTNVFIPAQGETSILMYVLPPYSQRKYYASRLGGDVIPPKQEIDYRIPKDSRIELELKFLTGLYGIEIIRFSRAPLRFRFSGKL